MAFIDYKTCEKCAGSGASEIRIKDGFVQPYLDDCKACEGRGYLREIVTDKPEVIRVARDAIDRTERLKELIGKL